MSDSPAPSADVNAANGYMPSYAQGYSNLADPYALQASLGTDPFLASELYGPFYPQSYVPQNPYAVPFAVQDPFLGQSFDLRSLYGPFTTPYPFSPYIPESPFAGMAPSLDVSALQNGEAADLGALSGADQGALGDAAALASSAAIPRPVALPAVPRPVSVPAPPIQHVHHVNPIHSTQTVHTTQPSEPMQPIQQSQPLDAVPAVQPAAQQTSQTNQSGATHPSVQVVVQPSQPFPAVQAQKAATQTAAPAPTMQSSMPTNVMQAVPPMGQQYGSGMLYPPSASPFFMDEYTPAFDPDLASGGRAAGATFLGILSIPFSVFAPLGLLFSLVGLHLANSYANNGGSRAVGNFARFFNVIGLILTTVITAAVALYVGYAAGQDGFLLFGQDPIAYINNSEPMQFLFDQWNKLIELWPWK